MKSSSADGKVQPALVSIFSVMYSSPKMSGAGADAMTVVFGLILAWTTAFAPKQIR